MKTNYIQLSTLEQTRLMNTFLCKALLTLGKENWCLLDQREYLEYGRRELQRRRLRQWWLSWISLGLKSLRSALSMNLSCGGTRPCGRTPLTTTPRRQQPMWLMSISLENKQQRIACDSRFVLIQWYNDSFSPDQSVLNFYDALSTFHDDDLCEALLPMLCSAVVWNSLPKTVVNSDSVTVFKCRLKTAFLFSRAFVLPF